MTNAEVYDAIKRNNAELKGSRRPFSAQEKDESVFLKAVEGYIKRHTNPTILKDRKKAEEYAKYLLDEGLSGIEIVQFSNFQPLEIVDVHIVILKIIFIHIYFSFAIHIYNQHIPIYLLINLI